MKPEEAVAVSIREEEFYLLPQKAIFFPNHSALLVSDVHLGKGTHFRKAGIAVPTHLEQEDLAILSDLIEKFKPAQLIFLGDLFHSELNSDWQWFKWWRELHREIEMVLVKGNHDIIDEKLYKELEILVASEIMLGPFQLRHDPPKGEQSHYVLCGHIHPAISLRGKGRQSLSLPCYFFSESYGILPAFGRFTGTARITAKKHDAVYAIAGKKVIEVDVSLRNFGNPFQSNF